MKIIKLSKKDYLIITILCISFLIAVLIFIKDPNESSAFLWKYHRAIAVIGIFFYFVYYLIVRAMKYLSKSMK